MIDWKPVDWLAMPPNKLMAFYSPKNRSVTVGYLDLSDDDPRGRLCDEDGKPLSFENYSHYCYAGTATGPIPHPADPREGNAAP